MAFVQDADPQSHSLSKPGGLALMGGNVSKQVQDVLAKMTLDKVLIDACIQEVESEFLRESDGQALEYEEYAHLTMQALCAATVLSHIDIPDLQSLMMDKGSDQLAAMLDASVNLELLRIGFIDPEDSELSVAFKRMVFMRAWEASPPHCSQRSDQLLTKSILRVIAPENTQG